MLKSNWLIANQVGDWFKIFRKKKMKIRQLHHKVTI